MLIISQFLFTVFHWQATIMGPVSIFLNGFESIVICIGKKRKKKSEIKIILAKEGLMPVFSWSVHKYWGLLLSSRRRLEHLALKFCGSFLLCDRQGAVRRAILYVNRPCLSSVQSL